MADGRGALRYTYLFYTFLAIMVPILDVPVVVVLTTLLVCSPATGVATFGELPQITPKPNRRISVSNISPRTVAITQQNGVKHHPLEVFEVL
jgi:hypothetical protein